MTRLTEFTWAQTPNGRWLVIENAGMLSTGSFPSKEKAKEWFRRALDIELCEESSGTANPA